ncbi:zinc-ribbon domain-containing protein [Jannaschia formosa]|uniref:zinc-ribbon domain-containing protein n=1 Tax=Jannaschia formosa TaxID=2259592 RepID=UPI001ADD6DD1|nr:zinc-ribbon domain-containing protein [Jannaschia formosa]
MRLTCPNCSAQYDIPADMIPAEGREVQCSNCATVWFQPGSGEDADAAPEDGPRAPSDRRPMADEATLDVLRQERAHEARLRAAERRRSRTLSHLRDPDEAEPALAESGEADPSRAAAAAEWARMATAASVARARVVPEAATEPEAPRPVPTVTDDVSEAIARTLREMALDRAKAKPEEDGLAEPPASPPRAKGEERRQARRNLLPDIEEINSSLRPDERALAAAAVEESGSEMELGEPSTGRVDRRSGFNLGFVAVLLLVGIAAALYLFAAPLARTVPSLESPLANYVATVDDLRVALEARVDAVAASILQSQ